MSVKSRPLAAALTLVLAGSPMALAACGGGDDKPDGPFGTFTAADRICSVATNGYVAKPGENEIRFRNETDGPVTISLLDTKGGIAASAKDLAPGATEDQEVELETGDHPITCDYGAYTQRNDGEGAPAGSSYGQSPPYTVGE